MKWHPMARSGFYARHDGIYFELHPVPAGVEVLMYRHPPDLDGWFLVDVGRICYSRTVDDMDEAKRLCESIAKGEVCDTG